MADGVTVLGLQDLGSSVDLFTQDVQKKMIRKAGNAGAEVFRREIRAKAPVRDDKYLKGKIKRPRGYLKRHIGRQSKVLGQFTYVVMVGPMRGAWYARLIEFGWHHQEGPRSEKPTTKAAKAEHAAHPNIAGLGFIRSSYDSRVGEAERVFTDTLKADIAEALK